MKILVVEGDPALSKTISEYCLSLDSSERAETVASGKAALARRAGLKPEMVVIDVDLPDGSGLDLIPKLRAKIPGLKVLVLSEQDRTLSYEARGWGGFGAGFCIRERSQFSHSALAGGPVSKLS